MFIGYDENSKGQVKILKSVNGEDRTKFGSFKQSEAVSFSVLLPRSLGVCSVIMRLLTDDGDEREIRLEFLSTSLGIDEYHIRLDLCELCESDGLFFYDFELVRADKSLYLSSINNVDCEMCERHGNRFRLLVYDNDFVTPSSYYGKTVYHIFVDRFYKGKTEVEKRSDAIMDNDWESGTPQYARVQGERISNNVFFGGTLYGVIEKLSYIRSLGADMIYLSPIFEAYSNHKYDTGDYEHIDSMFGGDKAFANLISEADKLGMKVILDGVFNHSGDDSVYFDKYGKYGNKGAYGDINSRYADWYTFKNHPDEYECWWGIDIHPRFNQNNDECREYFVGKDGITAKYIKEGAGGWRLDVADELSEVFLDELRKTVKNADPEAIIIGEVWENAADKIAYGKRRRYLRGKQLDSVMNYPLRSAIIDFLRYRDASILSDTLIEIYSSYPKCVCDCLLNILGTHDTERILTVLGGICDKSALPDGHSNEELSKMNLSAETRYEAKKLLKLAAVIQFTSYGIPSVFYGDEAGLEGYHDPFCRRTYPWGDEDIEMLEFYKSLGEIRRKEKAFREGAFEVLFSQDAFLAYKRGDDDGIIVLINRGDEEKKYSLDGKYIDILSDKSYNDVVAENTALILKKA